MKIGDRKEAKDTESMKMQLSQISDRPRLRELDVNVSSEGVKQQKTGGKAKRGVWKRRGQGERTEMVQHKDKNKENISDKGSKRGKEMTELTEAKHLVEDRGTRNKCMKLEPSSNSPMVEDPSHNWTQTYQ